MRRLVLSTCLLLAVPAHAAAQWTYASSDHFEAYVAGGARQAREAVQYFERVHAFFGAFLRLPPVQGPPTRLVVFSNDRDFALYRPTAAATAFYQPGPDRDHIVMRSLDEDGFPTVVHEYVHVVFRRTGASFPLWLSEGLAEFFSTIAPEGARMGIGRVPVGRLQYLNDRVAMMPLEQLLAVTASSREYTTQSHAGLFYSQSWALTHMLVTDSRYRPRLQTFLGLVSRGVAADEALALAYDKPLRSIAEDLIGYVRREYYTYLLADYQAPPDAAVVTRAADPFEVSLVAADLLASMPGREAQARSAYARLATERPDDLSLAESRALFEVRAGEDARAMTHLERAVRFGSRKASIYREYARLNPSQSEPLLRTAVELAPGDSDSRLRLAGILVGKRQGADALALLEPVSPSAEQAFVLHQLRASALAQVGRFADASAAAALALRHARSAEDAAMAERLQQSIAEFAVRSALAPDGIKY